MSFDGEYCVFAQWIVAAVINLTTLLHEAAHLALDRPAVQFLKNGETAAQCLTFVQLAARSSAVGRDLSRLFPPQQRIALLFDQPQDFLVGFFACQAAGLIAVPLPANNRKHLQGTRIDPYLRDAGAAAILCTSALRDKLHEVTSPCAILCLEELPEYSGDPHDLRGFDAAADSIAYLQYSSGSTGAPKGICITHENIYANLRQIALRLDLRPGTPVVSWLPHHHDQGLVGALLIAVYQHGTCHAMTPTSFVQRPLRWLEAISKYQAELSGGPDFAYELCAQSASRNLEALSLDLSCWRIAFNGAEPVRVATLEAFCRAFGPYGFRRRAFSPCYGLAESTLAVTMHPPGASAEWSTVERESTTLVGCGPAMPGAQITIIDPETNTELPPGEVGEIRVASAAVARGYWNQPERSARTFDCPPESQTPAARRGGLRTGDFGFLIGNELYVMGRREDQIIIRGRNYFTVEIESTAIGACGKSVATEAAVFTVDGDPHPSIAIEVKRSSIGCSDLERRAIALAGAVLRQHDLQLGVAYFVRQSSLPRTTSGKLQRNRCRQVLLGGQLPTLAQYELARPADRAAYNAASSPLNLSLCRLLSSLELVESGFTDERRELFWDSLDVLRLQHAIQQHYGVSLERCHPPTTVEHLAQQIRAAALTGDVTAGSSRSQRDNPLCELQHEIRIAEQLVSGSLYLIGCNIHFPQSVSTDHLQRCIRTLLERHPMLRMKIVEEEHGAEHYVCLPASVEIDDLSQAGGSSPASIASIDAWYRQQCNTTREQTLRVAVYHCAGCTTLCLTVRHLAADHWSMQRLVRELLILYDDLDAPLPISNPYDCFDDWYRDELHGRLDELRAYWRNNLTGVADLPTLTGSARVPFDPGHIARHRRELLPEATLSLERTCTNTGLSLSSLCMSVYALVIARCTGVRDLTIACPIALRHRQEFANTVGYLVNTLPVRVRLYESCSFLDFWSSVNQALSRAYDHSLYPAARIHADLGLARTDSISPLCRVMLNVLDQRQERFLAGDGSGPQVSVEPQPSHPLAELQLTIRRRDDRIDLELSAFADRYTSDFLTELGDSLEQLLTAVSGGLHTPLGRVEVVSPAQFERQTRFHSSARSAHRSLDQWVAHTGALHGERVAVRWREDPDMWGCLKYCELIERSRELAARLPCVQSAVVAIIMDCCAEQIISVLAILRAGAAYLSIDPRLPIERLRTILSDSKATLVLAQSTERARLAAAGIEIWDASEPAASALANVESTADSHFAALIYTSGSTGTPKGVAISHGAYINRLTAMIAELDVTNHDIFVQKTPLTFDVSVWELFLPLVTGACLVLADRREARDPRLLTRLLEQANVSIVHFVPSLLREWLTQMNDHPARLTLRACLCSGEPLRAQHRDGFAKLLPEVQLINLYGPTECAIDVTVCTELGTSGDPPLGRPTANVRGYVLDSGLRPLPEGAIGQLCIAGPQLAAGYWGRGEMTAERFVPSPQGYGERLYLTGDLARWGRDGQLRFCGRTDRQVKIHGVRVELDEIRSCLCRHPAITEAEVLLFESGADPAIGAMVVTHRDVSASELNEHLGKLLPPGMLPEVLLCTRELPLSSNGKCDQAAVVRMLRASRADRTADSSVPATLGAIWQGVLGVIPSTEVSFFAAGGDSVKAIRLVARLRQAGFELGVADVYRAPTLHELSRWLNTRLQADPQQVLEYAPFSLLQDDVRAKLDLGQLEDAYPLSMLQRSVISRSAEDTRYEVYLSSVLLRCDLQEQGIRHAIAVLLERHPLLRSSIELTQADEPLQLVFKTASPELVIHDWRELSAGEVRARLTSWRQHERHKKFRWEKPPLLRFAVHRLSNDEFVLHMAETGLDGWCVATALRELAASYDSFLTGRPPASRPALPSYGRFIAAERATMASATTRAYWARAVSHLLPQQIDPWPVDPAVAFEHRQLELRVPEQTLAALAAVATRESVSLKTLFMAVHTACLSAARCTDSVLVLAMFNGRLEDVGDDEVIGVFNNILPLQIELRGLTWRQLLHTCLEIEVAAQPYRRYPFAKILQHAGTRLLADVLFVFTEFHVLEAASAHERAKIADVWASDQTYLPLTVHVNRSTHHGTRVLLDYQSDQFSAEQVDWIGRTFLTLLDALPRVLDERCERRCDILRAAGRALGWRHGEGSFLDILERQCCERGDTPAVRAGADSVTYRELWLRCRRYAAFLCACGHNCGARIAIVSQAGIESVVAILGAWLAGICCVLLDPDEPRSRLIRKIIDSRVDAVATSVPLPELSEYRQIAVWSLTGQYPDTYPDFTRRELCSTQAAYILHTSGSTGAPKAVVVSHGALVNYIRWSVRRYDMASCQRVWNHSSVALDFTITTLLAPLAAGCTVECVDTGDIRAVLQRSQPQDLVKLTPAHVQVIRALDEPGTLADRIVVGGDRLYGRDVAALRELNSNANVFNEYGPTEACVGCSAHECQEVACDAACSIGQPIDAVAVYLLDANLAPITDSTVGEIYIGGKGLADGYDARGDLTAGRFIPNPFAARPGSRMYRTGDRARYSAGELVCLGRADRQVKRLGHRVELAEIEHFLNTFPDVASCAIDERDGRLLAWVVSATPELSVEAVRAYLMEHLPPQMWPNEIFKVESMPLGRGGKIDFAALREPDAVAPRSAGDLLAWVRQLSEQEAQRALDSLSQ